MSADLLGELNNWVVNGNAPTNFVVKNKNYERTRSLCEYPSWPKDIGGNVDLATSYS